MSEIIKLKNNGIKGLILDLRNNGGGSLQTVVEMTGLFIEKGPVVQVKSIGNRKKWKEMISDVFGPNLWGNSLGADFVNQKSNL